MKKCLLLTLFLIAICSIQNLKADGPSQFDINIFVKAAGTEKYPTVTNLARIYHNNSELINGIYRGAQRNFQNLTALANAVIVGDIDMVELLISKGANPNFTLKNGFSLMSWLDGQIEHMSAQNRSKKEINKYKEIQDFLQKQVGKFLKQCKIS